MGDRLQYMATGDDLLVFLYDDKGTPYGMFTVLDGVQQYFFYLYNAQGDVIAIIDDYAERVVNYEYSTWGELLSVTGSKADTVGTLNPFRYRGYCYDTETGFYYLNSRYYDPVTQRFVNGDGYASTGQGILGNNMFAYCLNNPVAYKDPSGEIALIDDAVYAVIGTLAVLSLIAIYISSTPSGKRSAQNFYVFLCDRVNSFQAKMSAHFAKKSKKSGKEKSTDKPSWVDKNSIDLSKSAQHNAKRLLDNKYGNGNWKKGSNSEYSKIVKWIQRSLKSYLVVPDDIDSNGIFFIDEFGYQMYSVYSPNYDCGTYDAYKLYVVTDGYFGSVFE